MAQDIPIIIETIGSIRIVKLNRPRKKNAVSHQMFVSVTNALEEAGKDDKIFMFVLTGVGQFYSSGVDLTGVMEGANDLATFVDQTSLVVLNFVKAFIMFPKLLIAIVNGPAIGVACTTLALFDVVYASDTAFFNTPFSVFGLTAEGCSSYTFPKIMGYSKAGDVLYLNRRLSAYEAKECGLVAEVYKGDELDTVIWPRLKFASTEYVKDSVLYSKQLVRRWDRDLLIAVNQAEVERLAERYQSPDVLNAVLKFATRKSKSKL